MTDNNKKKRNGYPPSNVSSHYYTDPVYSSDGFYGFEKDHDDMPDESIQEAADIDDIEALDEPVESWGWINNVDKRIF